MSGEHKRGDHNFSAGQRVYLERCYELLRILGNEVGDVNLLGHLLMRAPMQAGIDEWSERYAKPAIAEYVSQLRAGAGGQKL